MRFTLPLRLQKIFSNLLLRFFNFTFEQLLYNHEFQESFWSCGEPPRTMKSEDQLQTLLGSSWRLSCSSWNNKSSLQNHEGSSWRLKAHLKAKIGRSWKHGVMTIYLQPCMLSLGLQRLTWSQCGSPWMDIKSPQSNKSQLWKPLSPDVLEPN